MFDISLMGCYEDIRKSTKMKQVYRHGIIELY